MRIEIKLTEIENKITLCAVIFLMVQLPLSSAELNTDDSVFMEYNVAAGKIPESPGFLNFNLTPLNSQGLFFYDLEEKKDPNKSGYESLNFSVNNDKKIPANSFVYRTSMYKSDYGGFDIAWLGQPYHVIYHNETMMYISRWLVKPEPYKRSLADGETYILPDGFSITVLEIDTNQKSARFLIARNGEKIDDLVLKIDDVYEYKLDLDGSGHRDNLIMRFKLNGVFSGTEIDVVMLKEFQLLSPEVLKINNDDTTIFPFKGSVISFFGKPYRVIDHNDKTIYISSILVDQEFTYVLMKGESIVLPEGYNITLLDFISPWGDKGSKIRDEKIGHAIFSIIKNGTEMNNRSVKMGESYEYRVEMNGGSYPLISFTLKDIGSNSAYRGDFEKVAIKSVRLISLEVLMIENSGMINFASEGYQTNIEENGTTIKVTPGSDISLMNGGTTFFFGNWFSIRAHSDAVTVLSLLKDRSDLIGAFNYLVLGRNDFNLTAQENPAILFFDMDTGQGFEKLNFSIEKSSPEYSSYNIPADSLEYSTKIYSNAMHNNSPEIAWLGQHYSVIENTSSRFLISRFLLNENENNYHELEVGDSLLLPDGFHLNLLEINSSFSSAKFSLIQNDSEINNSILKTGSVYQYEKDLDSNGKEDNWAIRFNVVSINAKNNAPMVRITSIRMRSSQVLEISNDDIIENYRINITKDAKSLDIRINDPDNDIVLQENDITGILGNTFHIRLYKNGNAASVLEVLSEKDKIGQIGDLQVIPGVTESSTAEKTTGFEAVMAIAMLLCIIIMEFKRGK